MNTSTDTTATQLKDVMAGVCTPVAVVTAMDGARPHGTTVSAFASLSMTPPMVLSVSSVGPSYYGSFERPNSSE